MRLESRMATKRSPIYEFILSHHFNSFFDLDSAYYDDDIYYRRQGYHVIDPIGDYICSFYIS